MKKKKEEEEALAKVNQPSFNCFFSCKRSVVLPMMRHAFKIMSNLEFPQTDAALNL